MNIIAQKRVGSIRQSEINNQPFKQPFFLLRNSKSASIIHYGSTF